MRERERGGAGWSRGRAVVDREAAVGGTGEKDEEVAEERRRGGGGKGRRKERTGESVNGVG